MTEATTKHDPATEKGTQERAPGSRTQSGVLTPSRSAAAVETPRGKTMIADGVVAKIAGLAAREIPGVYDMGKGVGRTFGALRSRVPGTTGQISATQGVQVEVGQKQAAIDLDVVTLYGQSIVDVSEAIRRNVIERVESITGLEVTEVNISIDDLYVEGHDEEESPDQSRVQ